MEIVLMQHHHGMFSAPNGHKRNCSCSPTQLVLPPWRVRPRPPWTAMLIVDGRPGQAYMRNPWKHVVLKCSWTWFEAIIFEAPLYCQCYFLSTTVVLVQMKRYCFTLCATWHITIKHESGSAVGCCGAEEVPHCEEHCKKWGPCTYLRRTV